MYRFVKHRANQRYNRLRGQARMDQLTPNKTKTSGSGPFHPRRGAYRWVRPLALAAAALLMIACNYAATLHFLSSPLLWKTSLPPLLTLPVGTPAAGTPAAPAQHLTLPASHSAPAASNAYQPSAEISQLADASAMTPAARQLFFSARPQIDSDRILFEKHCQTQVMKNTVELGCFTTDNRIYLLRLTDPRLKSEMAVTAAHETLHVAYTQISTTDRTMVDGELETVVAGIQDADLLQRLKTYRTLEPGQRDNELHSILGTEYPALGDQLEQYYSQYFSDGRRAVVLAAQTFNLEFSQREAALAALQGQIKTMRRQMQADLSQRNNAAYNQLVPQINALVKQYNQAVRDYNGLSRDLMGEEPAAANQ